MRGLLPAYFKSEPPRVGALDSEAREHAVDIRKHGFRGGLQRGGIYKFRLLQFGCQTTEVFDGRNHARRRTVCARGSHLERLQDRLANVLVERNACCL